MVLSQLYDSVKETEAYLTTANELSAENDEFGAAWKRGKAFGNVEGAFLGMYTGGSAGFIAAEPVYQALETTVADVGPAVRLFGYSIPVAHAAVTGSLTYEGARIGAPVGKYLGRYSLGGVGLGLEMVEQGFEQVNEMLDDGLE